MKGEYESKTVAKLLAVTMVFALAFVAVGAIATDGVEAAGEDSATKMTGEEFLGLGAVDGSVKTISLTDDITLTSTVSVKENLTVELNGHSITTETSIDVFVVEADGVDLTITDSSTAKSGSITTLGANSSVVYVAQYKVGDSTKDYLPGDLVINGGTYTGGYTILWKGNGAEDSPASNKISVANATINATTAGLWFSYKPIKEATVNTVVIKSQGLGIYLAKCLSAEVKNSTVDADDGSAVEIKDGVVEISDCKLSTKSYVGSKTVGYSESGGAVSVVTINNAYADVDVSVTISGEKTVLTPYQNNKPVVITDDCVQETFKEDKTHKGWNVVGQKDITLTWAGHDSDVEVVYLKNTSTGVGVKTDAEAYKGLITVNSKVYVSDAVRAATATDSVYLLNDLTLSESFETVNLNGHRLTLKADTEATIAGKVIGAGGSSAELSSYKMKAGSTMTFSSGSIVIQETGQIIDTSAAGTITITGTAKVVGDTKINGTITLANGANLIIPADASLEANKIEIDSSSADAESTVTVYGQLNVPEANKIMNVEAGTAGVTVKVSSGASVSGVNDQSKISYTSEEKQFEFGDTLNSDYTVTKSEKLSNNLTIPAGVTLTISSTGVLNLAGCNIFVYGNLVVENGGVVAATTGTEKIVLMKGFSFTNDGILGQGSQAVTVTAVHEITDAKYDGVGSVKMKNVTGLVFSLVNTTGASATAQYTLAVSGNIVSDKNRDSDVSDVTFDGVRIVSDLTVGEDVVLTSKSTTTLMGSATLTVDGELNVKDLEMKNKATVVNNGIVYGKITADVADYQTSAGYAGGSVTVELVEPVAPGDVTTYRSGITGFTLTVDAVTETVVSSGSSVSMTYQRLYVSGDLDWVYSVGEYATPVTGTNIMKFSNTAYVAEGSELTVPKGMSISMTAGSLVVLGKVVMDEFDATSGKYTGAMYVVKTTSPKTTTYYIEPFAAAMASIDVADKKTVTVQQDVKIADELNIAAGQIVKIASGEFKVSETGVMTVAEKGKVEGTIAEVQGVLKVMKGASCAEPATYASKVSATDYVQYSGIAVALANANPGDTIEISKNTSVENDLVIPAGVTVKIRDGAEVKVGGNMKVEETAKVILSDSSKITMTGDKSKITVNGEMDATEGTVSGMKSIESAGKTMLTASNFESVKNVVSAFVYTDDDNNTVLTGAQAAIDADAAKDIPKGITAYGTVNGGDIELKTNLTIAENAKVTLGNVTVADGKKIDMTKGETTATIIAKTGVSGSEADSSVAVSKASGIVAGAGSEVDAQNVKTFVLYIFGDVKGGVEIAQGTAVVGYSTSSTLSVNGAGNTVAVKSGATLQVNDGMTFNVGVGSSGKASVTVDGTLAVATNGIVSVGYAAGAGSITVNGTLSIADSNVDKVTIGAGSKITVNGTVAVSTTEEKEAQLNLNGTMYIGKAPETLGANGTVTGAVAIGTGAYVVAYAGSDVSAAKFNWNAAENKSGAVSTQVVINGSELLTAYAKEKGVVDIIGNIVTDSIEIKGLNLDGIDVAANWSSDASKDVAITNKIGNNKAIYFNAPAAKVTGTISAGVGLSLFLNGVSVENYFTNGGYMLPVGQYKVTFEVQANYDGSNAVITFNGQTVSNNGMVTFSDDGFVLTANGAVPATQPTSSSDKDDGMGLTDILLIVLVVLIAVMAIMVALRMMRS